MKDSLTSLLNSEPGRDLNGANLPWLNSPSLYSHICYHLDPASGSVTPDGLHLPDQERHSRYTETPLPFAPGAADSLLDCRIDLQQARLLASQVSADLHEILYHDTLAAKIDLYQLLLPDRLLGFINETLNEIVSAGLHLLPALRDLALFLASTAPDRGPVKFSIVLLALVGNRQDVELVSLLGRHDEFTQYTIFALYRMLGDPEQALWDLACKVHGWGRVHTVQHLASTQSAQIKNWLVREGHRCQGLVRHIAYDCAVGGDLKAALAVPQVDDELLQAAGTLLSVLVCTEARKNLGEYADAARVVLRYLELLQSRPGTLSHYLVVDNLLGYLTEDWNWADNLAGGWNPWQRDQAIVLANQFLQRPAWYEIVAQALAAPDQDDFHLACRVADLLGMETWDLHWNRLLEAPANYGRWYYVISKADPQRIDPILSLALQTLPLAQVATGPAMETGLNGHYQLHNFFEYLVQNLEPFPTKGWAFIAAGLKSPVIRNRYTALRTLSAWGRENWPAGVEEALAEAFQIEPAQKVKETIAILIREGRLPDD